MRPLSVKKNYPQVGEVAIKRHHHPGTPRYAIRRIRRAIESHNKKYFDNVYEIKKPVAYPIGGEYILMAKAGMPTLAEIVGTSMAFGNVETKTITLAGKSFFKHLLKKSPKNKKLDYAGLRRAANLAVRRLRNEGLVFIDETELLLTEIKNGKPVFVPLIDLE